MLQKKITMPISRLLKVARQYRRRLLADEEEALKQIRRAYSANMAATLNELNRVEILINNMIERGDSSFLIYKELENDILDKLDKIEKRIKKFSNDSDEIVQDLQKKTARSGNFYARDNIEASLGKPPLADFKININTLDDDALEQFVGFASNGSPLRELFDTLAIDYKIDVEEYLQVGILNGENPRAIAQKIRQKSFIPLHRAETIARTESLRAARAATIENYNNNLSLIKQYQRMCSADRRTCPACWALHGTIYDLNQVMPSHPNCRCIIVPVTASWSEITGDPTLDDESDKIETKEELFSKLPDKQKKEILGPDRYRLWADGMPLDNFASVTINPDWGPTTRITPLRDLR